jgi:chemotaxis signal transduction protein
MDNLPDANSALISYIDSLLMDDSEFVDDTPPIRTDLPVSRTKNVVNATQSRELRVLFLKVAGIPLAMSLEDISGVIDGKETALPQHGWGESGILGTFNYRNRNIETLDTRVLILPDGHPARSTPIAWANSHIIVLADYEVGLLCDHVGNIANLQHREVEWRTQRHSRTWLAGMVRGYEHALLDVQQLLRVRGKATY